MIKTYCAGNQDVLETLCAVVCGSLKMSLSWKANSEHVFPVRRRRSSQVRKRCLVTLSWKNEVKFERFPLTWSILRFWAEKSNDNKTQNPEGLNRSKNMENNLENNNNLFGWINLQISPAWMNKIGFSATELRNETKQFNSEVLAQRSLAAKVANVQTKAIKKKTKKNHCWIKGNDKIGCEVLVVLLLLQQSITWHEGLAILLLTKLVRPQVTLGF